MSTAFVFSGGASLGAIQVGMLEALYERGIVPDLVVGTSAGALNAAFIAERPPTVETAHELADVWRGLHRGQVFPLNPLSGALGLLGARRNLVPDSGLRRLIERHSAAELIEDTRIPLHVIATDVLSGDDVRISSGPLVDAVMASAAIPGVLPAVDYEGRLLMDGGVANNAPLSHALELGADRLYVLPTGTTCELDEPPRGALAMLLYATHLLIGQRLASELAGLDARADIVVLPPPCPLRVQPTDFSHADELIEQGRTDARALLDRIDPLPDDPIGEPDERLHPRTRAPRRRLGDRSARGNGGGEPSSGHDVRRARSRVAPRPRLGR
jgi:NTE family protein